jgi:hypothetical protein
MAHGIRAVRCHAAWRGVWWRQAWDGEAAQVWAQLESLLRRSRADWTLFWRQLAAVRACYSSVSVLWPGVLSSRHHLRYDTHTHTHREKERERKTEG